MRYEIPSPPACLFDLNAGLNQFIPDGSFNQFVADHFLNDESPLFNPDHGHLAAASIGFVWTNSANKMRGRVVAGEAEMPQRYKSLRAGTWTVAILENVLTDWFGLVPDFKVTFNAEIWNASDDASRLALFEHELYHCGQAIDEFGSPKFGRDGMPKFRIRGHDIEQFHGVVRRYGVEATGLDAMQFAAAAGLEPEISRAQIALACGVCAV